MKKYIVRCTETIKGDLKITYDYTYLSNVSLHKGEVKYWNHMNESNIDSSTKFNTREICQGICDQINSMPKLSRQDEYRYFSVACFDNGRVIDDILTPDEAKIKTEFYLSKFKNKELYNTSPLFSTVIHSLVETSDPYAVLESLITQINKTLPKLNTKYVQDSNTNH